MTPPGWRSTPSPAVSSPRGVLLVTGAAYGAALAWAGRLVAARTLFPRLPEVLARLGRV